MSTESQSLETATRERSLINRLSEHVGEESGQGWLYNLRSSGKILFPQLRDGTASFNVWRSKNAVTAGGLGRSQALGQESAPEHSRTGSGGQPSAGGYEIDLLDAEVINEVPDYPINAQRARHRVLDGSSPPLAKVAATARDPQGSSHCG